ncbi:MAG: hypothetical protein WBN75_19870 [Verrucomicrobiia bacterium]
MFKAVPNCLRLLLQTVRALLSPDLGQRRQYQRAQNGEGDDDDRQFNQREGAFLFFRTRRGPIR